MTHLQTVQRAAIYLLLIPFLFVPLMAWIWSRLFRRYQDSDWFPTFLGLQLYIVVSGVTYTVFGMTGHYNLWFRHLTVPITFVWYLMTLFQALPPFPRRRQIYGGLAFLGLAAALISFRVEGVMARNAVFTTTQNLVFIGLACFELKRFFASNDSQPLQNAPEFWLLAALLIYGSGALIFDASSNYFLRALSPDHVLVPWIVINFILAVTNCLLAKVFLCPKPISS